MFETVDPSWVHWIVGNIPTLAALGWCTRLPDRIGQIFNLGVESHDDLNDALAHLLLGLANQGLELPKIHWIEG
jgi:hypothetical protein